ncbi:MAG: glycoside hydrolase family 36 protein [Anaerolineae bacterium]
MQISSVRQGRPSGIEIAFGEQDGRRTARYVSDTTVRDEELVNGRYLGRYWSASGQVPRPVGPGRGRAGDGLDPLMFPTEAFELDIDGQRLHNHWAWEAAYEREGSRPGTVEAVVELRHQVRPITLKVVTRVDGSPILTRWLEITNTGAAAASLSHVSPCSGILWKTSPYWIPATDKQRAPFSLGYLRSENRGEEGDLVWTDLPVEGYRIERTKGTNYGPPYFIVRNELTGEMFFLALAWSRNWYAEFKAQENRLSSVTAGSGDLMLSFGAGPLAPAPQRVIAPGETVLSPELHIGPVHRSLDAALLAWQQHMRASVLPPRPEGKEMYTVAGHVIEYPGEWILREIDIAAEMGVKAFMVDAGWYGREFGNWTNLRGDWIEGDWLPGGIAGIRDYAHSKGLLFGLWMEPEQAGDQSDLYTQHPDWFLHTDEGREVTSGRTHMLDLANPEAARYMEDSVMHVIGDLQLDFFKIDYNVSVYEGGENQQGDWLENENWRHCEVLYKVFDRVRRELPQVALEDCAGGGGRNDIGMASRFHYVCQSDLSWFPRSIRSINGLGTFLPPEAVAYYHNHVGYAHQTADLDTHLRVGLFATVIHVGFGAQDDDRTTPYYVQTKRYIALANDFCYPIIAEGANTYHHTPEIGVSAPADWCVIEYAAPDRTRAYAGVFSLNGKAESYLFRPRGLDASLKYAVTTDNNHQTYVVTGRDLVENGVTVRLDSNLTSELLLFRAVEG